MAEKLMFKKQFIKRALFPFGESACRGIGIVPTSDDVQLAEQRQAAMELRSAPPALTLFAMERAEWYVNAYEALLARGGTTDENEYEERSLEEHLMAFGTALLIEERM